MALSGRESSLVQTFCEPCVHLDIAHPSVHMARRFVIQGCPTLRWHGRPSAEVNENINLGYSQDQGYS